MKSKLYPDHIIVKEQKTSDKYKILKAIKEKIHTAFKGAILCVKADVSTSDETGRQ